MAPDKRAPAARLWAMTGAVAAALGPALGGGLVQVSWQWAFWINLPVGLLLLFGALRYVPDVRLNLGDPLPDLVGALLLVLAVGGLVLGLVQGTEWGWTSTGVLGSFAVSILALLAFGRRTLRHPSPIIAPGLLAVQAFRWANLATLVFNSAFGAALLGAILWLQQAWHYGALQTGLAIALGRLAVPDHLAARPPVVPVRAARLDDRGRQPPLRPVGGSWVHERDVLLPLGRPIVVEDDEVRGSLRYVAALALRSPWPPDSRAGSAPSSSTPRIRTIASSWSSARRSGCTTATRRMAPSTCAAPPSSCSRRSASGARWRSASPRTRRGCSAASPRPSASPSRALYP